jgi:hypothetical protein
MGHIEADELESPDAAMVCRDPQGTAVSCSSLEYSQIPTSAAGRAEPEPSEPGRPEPPEPELTWVDISLVDEHGKPVAGEPYRVIDARSQVFEGELDDNGFAHIEGLVRGECMITFPNRPAHMWRRTSTGSGRGHGAAVR